tara:strand:- start:363 stop:470 length:108 start_codon:yes stop_codon:yes gene_type:complete
LEKVDVVLSGLNKVGTKYESGDGDLSKKGKTLNIA